MTASLSQSQFSCRIFPVRLREETAAGKPGAAADRCHAGGLSIGLQLGTQRTAANNYLLSGILVPYFYLYWNLWSDVFYSPPVVIALVMDMIASTKSHSRSIITDTNLGQTEQRYKSCNVLFVILTLICSWSLGHWMWCWHRNLWGTRCNKMQNSTSVVAKSFRGKTGVIVEYPNSTGRSRTVASNAFVEQQQIYTSILWENVRAWWFNNPSSASFPSQWENLPHSRYLAGG